MVALITDEIRLTDNEHSDVIQEVNLVRPDLSSITLQIDNYTSLAGSTDNNSSLSLKIKDYLNPGGQEAHIHVSLPHLF